MTLESRGALLERTGHPEAKRFDLRVIPPLCPLAVSAADFTQAGTLIERARRATGEWIDSGADRRPTPERFLSLHSHQNPRAEGQGAVSRRASAAG